MAGDPVLVTGYLCHGVLEGGRCWPARIAFPAVQQGYAKDRR